MVERVSVANLKRNIFIFVTVVFLAFLFWQSFSIQELFYKIVNFFERYSQDHKVLGMVIFVGMGILSAMISPFSSAPLIPIAVIIWGNFLTFILLALGWLVGAIITYYIGYFAGYFLLKDVIPYKKIKYYQQRFPPRAQFWLVLMFRFSMPAEIPGYTLGIIRYDFGKYFLATVISEVPFALISVYASKAFLVRDSILFFVLTGSIFVLMSVMFFLFHKYLYKEIH